MAPECLVDLIEFHDVDRLLLAYKHYLSSQARRSFSYIAPKLWNNLPDEIRFSPTLATFKSKIKYLLFNKFDNFMKSVFKYNQ